jgi:hypothetical protein
MTRWIFRAIGILMILIALLLMANLQQRLREMQPARTPATRT